MKHGTLSKLPVYDFKASLVPVEQMLFIMGMASRVKRIEWDYKIHLVGGALRDLYLGGIVNDLDIYMNATHFNMHSGFRPLGEYTGETTLKTYDEESKFRVHHFEPSNSKPHWRPVDLVVFDGRVEQYIDTFDFGINQIWWDFEGRIKTHLMESRLSAPGQLLYVNNRDRATFNRAEGLCAKYSHLGFRHDIPKPPPF